MREIDRAEFVPAIRSVYSINHVGLGERSHTVRQATARGRSSPIYCIRTEGNTLTIAFSQALSRVKAIT